MSVRDAFLQGQNINRRGLTRPIQTGNNQTSVTTAQLHGMQSQLNTMMGRLTTMEMQNSLLTTHVEGSAPGYLRLTTELSSLGISVLPPRSLEGVSDDHMATIAASLHTMRDTINSRHILENERTDLIEQCRERTAAHLELLGGRI